MRWNETYISRFYQVDGAGGGGADDAGGGNGAPVGGDGGSPGGGDEGGGDSFEAEGLGMDSVEVDEGGAEPQQVQVRPPAQPGQQPQQNQPKRPGAPQAQPPQRQVQQPQLQRQEAEESGPRPVDIQAIRSGIQRDRAQLIDHLAANQFALSQADVQALEEDAVAAIPKLLARTAIDAAMTSLGQIHQLVPQLIQQHLGAHDRGKGAEDEFYATWPGLNRAQHGRVVTQMAQAIRAANPQMSRAEAIKLVGTAVSAQFGIPVQMKAPGTPQQQQNGGARRGFVPARPGARVPAGQPQVDPWSGLGQDFED